MVANIEIAPTVLLHTGKINYNDTYRVLSRGLCLFYALKDRGGSMSEIKFPPYCPMGFGQYNSLREYYGLSTASGVFLIFTTQLY